jgi:hypothetical protein
MNLNMGEIKMKKLNKIIAGISLAAVLIAGAPQAGAQTQEASDTAPIQTYSVSSDPGNGGGH